MAHNDELEMVKLRGDKDFLLAQCGPGRHGTMESLAKREARKHRKTNRHQKRKHILVQNQREITRQVELQSSSTSSDSDANSSGPSSKKPCYESISAGKRLR